MLRHVFTYNFWSRCFFPLVVCSLSGSDSEPGEDSMLPEANRCFFPPNNYLHYYAIIKWSQLYLGQCVKNC